MKILRPETHLPRARAPRRPIRPIAALGLALALAANATAATTVTPLPSGATLPAPASPQIAVDANFPFTYAENGEACHLTYIAIYDLTAPAAIYYLAPGYSSSPTPIFLGGNSCTATFTDPRSLPAGSRTYSIVVYRSDWTEAEVWVNGQWVDDWDWVDDEFVVVGSHYEDDHWDTCLCEDPWTVYSEHTVTFTLTAPSLVVTHTAGAPTYQPGGTVTVTTTISFPGEVQALGLDVMIPTGWSYVGGGNEGGIKPATGATDFLEWAWTTRPPSPVVFTYTLNVPAGATGAAQVLADAILRRDNTKEQATAASLAIFPAP